MGGYGSGRSGGWLTVEDSLTLNLPRLFKTGWLKAGAWTSGNLSRLQRSLTKIAAGLPPDRYTPDSWKQLMAGYQEA